MDFSFCFSTLLPVPKIVFKCAQPINNNSNSNSSSSKPAVSQPVVQQQKQPSYKQHNPPRLHLEIPNEKVITLETCEQILNDLIKNRELSVFRKRVSDSEQDYLKIVKNPMDFETLKHLLTGGAITSVTEFKENLDLIWSNCRLYNGEYSSLSKLANDIRREIDDFWDGCIVNDKKSFADFEKSYNKLEEVESLLNDINDDFEKLMDKNQLMELKRRPLLPKLKGIEKRKQNVDEKFNNLPPNIKQLKEMADKISNTPPDQLKEVWNILKPILIGHRNNNNSEELHSFSLNDLPMDTLISLKRLLIA